MFCYSGDPTRIFFSDWDTVYYMDVGSGPSFHSILEIIWLMSAYSTGPSTGSRMMLQRALPSMTNYESDEVRTWNLTEVSLF